MRKIRHHRRGLLLAVLGDSRISEPILAVPDSQWDTFKDIQGSGTQEPDTCNSEQPTAQRESLKSFSPVS